MIGCRQRLAPRPGDAQPPRRRRARREPRLAIGVEVAVFGGLARKTKARLKLQERRDEGAGVIGRDDAFLGKAKRMRKIRPSRLRR